MKKICTVLTAILLATTPLTAYADVLIIPENDFYEQHYMDFQSLYRSFEAQGTVSVMKSPDSRTTVQKFNKGDTVHVNLSCLYNGDYWGSVGDVGWVRLEQFLVYYDSSAFMQEYADELYVYNGNYDEIIEAGSVFMWSWPGSDGRVWKLEHIDEYFDAGGSAYRDADGREWGYVGYYRGRMNSWACLSDPHNEDIPRFNPEPAPTKWKPTVPHNNIEGASGNSLVLVVVLITVLAIGTVVLIKVLFNNGRKKI